jgi:multidrug resistance efflux pump
LVVPGPWRRRRSEQILAIQQPCQLDHTVVKAPFAGVVTNVPSIAPGKYLAGSTTAFYLVDTDHVWVDATPKETELTYVRPGQPVTATVDTYPDAEWHSVDIDFEAHPGTQRRQILVACVDADPHRDPLHDLHPVAARSENCCAAAGLMLSTTPFA